MFHFLPEEMERQIWRFYYSMYVTIQVDSKKEESVWNNPSDRLVVMCSDTGAYQHTYSELEKCVKCKEAELKQVVLNECFENVCPNCVYHGFPCANARIHGGLTPKINHKWIMEYK